MKKLLITTCLMLLCFLGVAQRPYWIKSKPAPTNNTYLYIVESASGSTEMAARNLALGEVLRSTAMRMGQPFNSEVVFRALQSGTDYSVISNQYNIPINKVCEYSEYEQNQYRVYILCQVAKAGNISVSFDNFSECYKGNEGYYGKEALYADGFCIYKNGDELKEWEIRTLFANSKAYDMYDKGKKREDSFVLTVIGTIAIIPGVTCTALGYVYDYCQDLRIIGPCIITGGGVLILIDAWRRASGKSKIRKAVNLYNNGRIYSSLDIGFTGNGMYLTLNF